MHFPVPLPRHALSALLAALLVGAAVPGGAASAQSPDARRSVVVGAVLDATTDTPVARAIVSVEPGRRRVLTDSAGRFRLVAEKGIGTISVERIGYETTVLPWTVEADTVEMELTLVPATVMLAELRVELDRLDRVARSAPSSVRRIDEGTLSRSSAPDALQAVRDRFGLVSSPCSGLSTSASGECLRVRGTPTRVCAIVDEAPLAAGVLGLTAYRPADLGRVYVVGGGRVIIAYTRGYLEGVKRRERWIPLSIPSQMLMFCRG